ncbi:MAG: helix-turn-helix transcriptional regulator [Anaerolineaceae bacterium]|nr:helix-turn-helix transcriptional regulator [Anaerolineaceae bacterium]
MLVSRFRLSLSMYITYTTVYIMSRVNVYIIYSSIAIFFTVVYNRVIVWRHTTMAIECKFSVLLASRSAKERKRIPLTEVQAATGITWQTLQKWSINKVKSYDAQVLDKLCEFFACETGDLLTYIPNTEREPEAGNA